MKSALSCISRICLLACVCVVLGCSPGSEPVAPPAGGIKDQIKANLANPSETGQIGSETMAIEMDIKKLEAEDPALATTLTKDLEELKKASSPAAVKAKAKAMAAKL